MTALGLASCGEEVKGSFVSLDCEKGGWILLRALIFVVLAMDQVFRNVVGRSAS